MQNVLRISVVGTMALAILSAQGRGPGHSGTPPTSAEMVQMRIDMMTRRLALTEAQQLQAKTIFTQAATATEAPRASLKSVMDNIQAAVKKNDTATIDQLSITAGTLSGQLMAAERKGDAAFYALLTADQKTKFDSAPMGRGGPGGFGGPGAMGFGGPDGGPRPMRGPRPPVQ